MNDCNGCEKMLELLDQRLNRLEDNNNSRFSRIEQKLDDLSNFKFQLIGIFLVLAFIIEVILK